MYCSLFILVLCICSAAWIDKCRPDILISESTYATTIRDSKRCRERDFLKKVHESIERGGKVIFQLVACCAIGAEVCFTVRYSLICFLINLSGSYSSLRPWTSSRTLHSVGDILVEFTFKRNSRSINIEEVAVKASIKRVQTVICEDNHSLFPG